MDTETDEGDTVAPMRSQQPPPQQQQAGAAANKLAAAVGRRGTMLMPQGHTGQRRSVVGGMLGRSTLMTLSNLAANSRRSKAQEVRLENTYRMAPKDEERLRCWKLRPLMMETLRELLTGYEYSHVTAGRKACDAALAIRNRVREFGFERYKFVVCVLLMESRTDSSVCLTSRAMWATGDCGDNWTEAACAGKSARAHATLHALYYE